MFPVALIIHLAAIFFVPIEAANSTFPFHALFIYVDLVQKSPHLEVDFEYLIRAHMDYSTDISEHCDRNGPNDLTLELKNGMHNVYLAGRFLDYKAGITDDRTVIGSIGRHYLSLPFEKYLLREAKRRVKTEDTGHLIYTEQMLKSVHYPNHFGLYLYYLNDVAFSYKHFMVKCFEDLGDCMKRFKRHFKLISLQMVLLKEHFHDNDHLGHLMDIGITELTRLFLEAFHRVLISTREIDSSAMKLKVLLPADNIQSLSIIKNIGSFRAVSFAGSPYTITISDYVCSFAAFQDYTLPGMFVEYYIRLFGDLLGTPVYVQLMTKFAKTAASCYKFMYFMMCEIDMSCSDPKEAALLYEELVEMGRNLDELSTELGDLGMKYRIVVQNLNACYRDLVKLFVNGFGLVNVKPDYPISGLTGVARRFMMDYYGSVTMGMLSNKVHSKNLHDLSLSISKLDTIFSPRPMSMEDVYFASLLKQPGL